MTKSWFDIDVFEFHCDIYRVEGYYEAASYGNYWSPSYDADVTVTKILMLDYLENGDEIWVKIDPYSFENKRELEQAILEDYYDPERFID